MGTNADAVLTWPGDERRYRQTGMLRSIGAFLAQKEAEERNFRGCCGLRRPGVFGRIDERDKACSERLLLAAGAVARAARTGCREAVGCLVAKQDQFGRASSQAVVLKAWELDVRTAAVVGVQRAEKRADLLRHAS